MLSGPLPTLLGSPLLLFPLYLWQMVLTLVALVVLILTVLHGRKAGLMSNVEWSGGRGAYSP